MLFGVMRPPQPPSVLLESLLQPRDGPVAVVAHRGASSDHPENTMVAFEAAMDLVVDSIEFDVRASRVGSEASRGDELVCIHDATLQRTARGGGEDGHVGELGPVELAAVDVGSFQGARFGASGVPTLRSALEAMCRRTVPMIERKDGAPGAYLELLEDLGMLDGALLQAFDWEWLAEVRDREPAAILGALGGGDGDALHPSLSDSDLDRLVRLGVRFLHWREDRTDRALVERAHGAGLRVAVFTADREVDFERLVDAGVDMITTNEPARLRDWRRGST